MVGSRLTAACSVLAKTALALEPCDDIDDESFIPGLDDLLSPALLFSCMDLVAKPNDDVDDVDDDVIAASPFNRSLAPLLYRLCPGAIELVGESVNRNGLGLRRFRVENRDVDFGLSDA